MHLLTNVEKLTNHEWLQNKRCPFMAEGQTLYFLFNKSQTPMYSQIFTLDDAYFCNKRFRSRHLEVFLEKRCSENVQPWCSIFTGEHPCRSVISIKLQSSFIELALRHVCSPVNSLHIFRTPFPKNACGWLLLEIALEPFHWNF